MGGDLLPHSSLPLSQNPFSTYNPPSSLPGMFMCIMWHRSRAHLHSPIKPGGSTGKGGKKKIFSPRIASYQQQRYIHPPSPTNSSTPLPKSITLRRHAERGHKTGRQHSSRIFLCQTQSCGWNLPPPSFFWVTKTTTLGSVGIVVGDIKDTRRGGELSGGGRRVYYSLLVPNRDFAELSPVGRKRIEEGGGGWYFLL